jgi:hypothetical protein
MIKKILLSLAMFGFVFGSPILANAASFTSLKAQLFDLSSKIESFKKVANTTEIKGEVLGATSAGVTVTATPSAVFLGQPFYLEHRAEDVLYCKAYSTPAHPDWQWEQTLTPTPGTYNILIGKREVRINQTTVFNLDCTSPDGSQKQGSVTVSLIPNEPKITFTAEPSEVPFSGQTILNWKFDNPAREWQKNDHCYAEKDWSGSKTLEGKQVILGIKTDKTFVLNCISGVSFNFTKYTKVVKVKVIKPDDKDKTPTEPVPTGGSNTNIVTNSNTTNLCTFTFTKDLTYGSTDSVKNKDVSLMQSVLVDEGSLSEALRIIKTPSEIASGISNMFVHELPEIEYLDKYEPPPVYRIRYM